MNVRLVMLPDGEDPDSYHHKVGTEAFKNYLKDSEKDFVIFKTDLLLGEAGDDPIRRAGVLKDIVSSIANSRCHKKESICPKMCIDDVYF